GYKGAQTVAMTGRASSGLATQARLREVGRDPPVPHRAPEAVPGVRGATVRGGKVRHGRDQEIASRLRRQAESSHLTVPGSGGESPQPVAAHEGTLETGLPPGHRSLVRGDGSR